MQFWKNMFLESLKNSNNYFLILFCPKFDNFAQKQKIIIFSETHGPQCHGTDCLPHPTLLTPSMVLIEFVNCTRQLDGQCQWRDRIRFGPICRVWSRRITVHLFLNFGRQSIVVDRQNRSIFTLLDFNVIF